MGAQITNIVLPVLIAVGSVYATFWFREKQNTLNALRALRTELNHNDDLVENMLHDLFSDRDDDPNLHDLQSRDSVPLQTSAYKNFVNSGIATKIDDDLEDSIWYHYLVVRKVNRDVERRQDSLGLYDVKSLDDKILNSILYLSGYRRLEVMETNVRNDSVEEKIRDRKDDQKELEDTNWENVTEHTFDAVAKLVRDEIDEKHWIPTRLLKRKRSKET